MTGSHDIMDASSDTESSTRRRYSWPIEIGAPPRRYSWSLFNETWDLEDAIVDGRWDLVEKLHRQRPLRAHLRSWPCLIEKGTPDMYDHLEQFGWPFREEGHWLLPRVVHKPELVEWLLDHGARIDCPQSAFENLARGQWDRTLAVLNAAAKQGQMAVFDYLVSRGADPSRCNPLPYAAQYYTDPDPDRVDAVITHLIETYH